MYNIFLMLRPSVQYIVDLLTFSLLRAHGHKTLKSGLRFILIFRFNLNKIKISIQYQQGVAQTIDGQLHTYTLDQAVDGLTYVLCVWKISKNGVSFSLRFGSAPTTQNGRYSMHAQADPNRPRKVTVHCKITPRSRPSIPQHRYSIIFFPRSSGLFTDFWPCVNQ